MSPADNEEVVIRPAATVILLRDTAAGLETLLLRRNSRLAFAGGAWVFPGGSFEASDYELSGTPDEHQTAGFAAARETLEETGLTVNPDEFVYYAHWTTPPVMPKRYATWFFVTKLDRDEDVLVDGSEIKDHIWATPEDALARRANKEIEMMPPTFVSLFELGEFGTADEALAGFAAREAKIYHPRFSKADGQTVALYEGDAGYESADATLAGARHRCWMGEEQPWSYEHTL